MNESRFLRRPDAASHAHVQDTAAVSFIANYWHQSAHKAIPTSHQRPTMKGTGYDILEGRSDEKNAQAVLMFVFCPWIVPWMRRKWSVDCKLVLHNHWACRTPLVMPGNQTVNTLRFNRSEWISFSIHEQGATQQQHEINQCTCANGQWILELMINTH